MKRRCVPLRADHNLLTPDTHKLSGVRLHPDVQVRSQVVTSLSGHLNDLSSSETAVWSTRRRPPVASPTRRLRFEDETEKEAESRYQERQRRRVGQQGTCVLVSKPDMNLYMNGRVGTGPQGAEHVVDRQQRGRTAVRGMEQFDSCVTGLGGGVTLNFHPHPPVNEDRGLSLHRPHLNLRTEPIRETYIGSVTPGDTSVRGGGHYQQVRGTTNQVEQTGHRVNLLQATPTTDLPINPYAPIHSKCPSLSSPSVMMSQRVRLNGGQSEENKNQSWNQNQQQEQRGKPAAGKPEREVRSGPDLKEGIPSMDERGLEPRRKTSSTSLTPSTLERTAESQATPPSESSTDGQVRQPMRAESHSEDASLPEHFIRRDESSRLSLRRLFSSVTLNRTRTGSLDRLSSRPRPSAPDPAPTCPRKSSGMLKKTLSVQSLSVQGSPFLQLRKSSSVQNVVSEQKKKKGDRSADYRPAADQVLQRSLSLEDVGRPTSVRSVGRVLQVCSDGTFLLELSRPKNRKFGFMISRGTRDTGVYVNDMVDGGTEKLYAGLLAVGDEILEVNGEKVACLSLDQVTQLLTQNTSTRVQVLRHWRTPPQ